MLKLTDISFSCRIIPWSQYTRGLTPMTGGFQTQANIACARAVPGAGLVTINDMAENRFIFDWVLRFSQDPLPVWTGLHRPMSAVAGFRPVWMSGETGITDLVDPLDYGEGAVLFLVDPFQPGPKWEGEDQFERGIPISALCEYKLPREQPTSPPAPPTWAPAQPTNPAPPTRRRPIRPTGRPFQPNGRPIRPNRGPIRPNRGPIRPNGRPTQPRPRLNNPPFGPFGPGPLYNYKPLGPSGLIQERSKSKYSTNERLERLRLYPNGNRSKNLAIP